MYGGEWVGQVIDGRYAVEDVLGAGGMGVVLRCLHKFTGARVAVKVLRPDFALDKQVQQRFLGEARAPNTIGHPGIVKVTDAGQMPGGALYLAMDLVAGESLRQVLQRGGLNAAETRRIGLALLDVLAAAHAAGFVHRDLKPENVMLASPGGAVKLLDFGIAKVLATGIPTMGTAAGVMLGTPGYMAPEQLQDASGVDARADLWAVGIILYELLSGRLPYPARTLETVLHALATEEPAPISRWMPDLAPEIVAFFGRALSRDPNGRFASAQEMAAAVAGLPLGTAPVMPVMAPPAFAATAPGTMASAAASATLPPILAPVPEKPRSSKSWLAIVGVVAALAVIGLGAYLVSGGHKGGVTPPVDAAPVVARVDAPLPLADAPTPVVDALDVVATCKALCPRFIACGLQYADRCEIECEKQDPRGKPFLSCADTLAPGCPAFARCVYETTCGTTNVGGGHDACLPTAECQGACVARHGVDTPATLQCTCGCAARAHTSALLPLLQLNVTAALYGLTSKELRAVMPVCKPSL